LEVVAICDHLFLLRCCPVFTESARYHQSVPFFYTVTLGQDKSSVPIPPIKNARRLPEILSANELERVFAALSNIKHRMLLSTPRQAEE